MRKSINMAEKTPSNLGKVPSLFERDLSKTNAKLPNFTDVCMVGGKFVPTTIQTSVKFRDFVEQYLRSLLTHHPA